VLARIEEISRLREDDLRAGRREQTVVTQRKHKIGRNRRDEPGKCHPLELEALVFALGAVKDHSVASRYRGAEFFVADTLWDGNRVVQLRRKLPKRAYQIEADRAPPGDLEVVG
jgi:hypothetical protein